MSTRNVLYVRASDPSTEVDLRTVFPAAYSNADAMFFAIEQPEDRYHCSDQQLRSLSARFKTDVIWMSYQSAVDGFQYRHWNNGVHVRSLVYGCFGREREWERADGEPQGWEADVLFGEICYALESSEDEDEQRKIERIYRERIIKQGAVEPSLTAIKTADGVAQFFRFPGW